MRKGSFLLIALVFQTFVFAQKITEVKTKDLPKAAVKYIRINMIGATVFKAVKLDDHRTILYNVAVDVHGNKQILVFDKNGKFIKKGDKLTKPITTAGKKNITQKTDHSQQTPPKASSKK